MAARTRKQRHDEFTRQKIQTTQLVKRLTSHALGELKIEMSPTQVTAALGLLRKSLPDLQASASAGEGFGSITLADLVQASIKEE